jgi:hypothetical protein
VTDNVEKVLKQTYIHIHNYICSKQLCPRRPYCLYQICSSLAFPSVGLNPLNREKPLDPPESRNSFRGSTKRSLVTTLNAPSRPATGKLHCQTECNTTSNAQIKIVLYYYSRAASWLGAQNLGLVAVRSRFDSRFCRGNFSLHGKIPIATMVWVACRI